MAGTIDVDELRVGMFIHLDLSWMQHPFPVGSFRITHEQQIDKIRSLGLKQLRWSPEKSVLAPPPGPAAAQDDEAGHAATAAAAIELPPPSAAQQAERQRREQLDAQRASAALCQAQFDEAGQAWRAALDLVTTQPERARQGSEDLTRALLDKMLVDGDMCIRLLTCNAGDNASAHAMNVAVISLLMGRVFGLGDDEMLDLGLGALLHDVGKIGLPDRLRHADERFGKDDLAAYRDHVAQGVQQGKRMGLKPGALLVLAQHHEHADGSGFPLRLKAERMSAAARIVALVNRYDNLCNPPSLANALTPHEALSLLFAQGRSQFDASMLNSFIRMMGVYPAGSVVQLTDDRYALVMSVNSTRPLKPNVLVHDAHLPRDEALHLNLMHLPDLGIRRSLKPSQLPAAALDYLAPRPRVAYFFEAARVAVAEPEDRVPA
jgi:HD-GYP domain-containing protein (c-di-GMP phosphodiesterase class II)